MPPAALVESPAPPAPAQVSNRSTGCRRTFWRSAALPEGASVALGAGRAASISHTNSLAHSFPHSHRRSFTHSFIHSQGRSLIRRAPAESSLCPQPSPKSWGHAVNIPRACFTCGLIWSSCLPPSCPHSGSPGSLNLAELSGQPAPDT